MTIVFVDRSNNNGSDDYKAAPVTHAYFKATDGTTFVDSTYTSRCKAARAAGAIVGAYHFAEQSDPATEADHFLSTIGKQQPGWFRPCLDLEGGQTAGWAEAFVKHVEARLGYLPVLYGNTSQISTVRAASVLLRSCPWWRAEYGPNDGARHTLAGGEQGAAAHQYTSAAAVRGISGHTDQSVFLQPVEAMLVPAPRKKYKRPEHYTLTYVDATGKTQAIKSKHPGLWQARHPRARWRGTFSTTPHPKP
jgi:GH25 family lysozyme M1 (1,4-beta-N-acetylmuramidase)